MHGRPIQNVSDSRRRYTTLAQLQVDLDSLNVALNAEQLSQLNAASKIDVGFPHDFLALNEIRQIVFSGLYDQMDNHRA